MTIKLTVTILLLFGTLASSAQDSTLPAKAGTFPDKAFNSLHQRASRFEGRLNRQTAKYLSKLQKQEHKLKKKLWKKDSLLAKDLFSGVEEKYQQLSKAPERVNKYAAAYSGRLDSLSTSLNFLKNNDLVNGPQLQKTLGQYKSLQAKLDQAEAIKKYINERQKLLREQLQNLGMLKELKDFQKQAYYYKTQIAEYKELWEDPSKLEARLLQEVQKLPQFKEFFANNSMLGSLFALPGSSPLGGGQVGAVSLAGLQTRASVNQSLIDRFGSGPNTTQMLRNNMQAAQAQLTELKNKISGYGAGSFGNSGEVELPEGFKPNHQKTKSFLKRLEYGANVQTTRGSRYFPVVSDLALSLGYKASDKMVIGVGFSQKIGWGKSWDHIKITHQGMGLRSYLDWKLKGSLYLAGAYEQNYRPLLRDLISPSTGGGRGEAWQSSGLIGLSKKFRLSSPRRGRQGGGLKGEMKLLWDFLSYQQVPRTQAIIFRIGYSLK